MKDWIAKNDQPIMLKIDRIEDEAADVKTFYFTYALKSRPGQFVIMWIPEVNEKPFSIAYGTGETFGLTIAKVGPFTEKLYTFTAGDRVGIRGPYGKPFTEVKGAKTVVMVGGGYGIAPLAALAEELVRKGVKVHIINGARSQDTLLYQDRLAKLDAEVHYTTDDGSHGEKGLVTQPLQQLLESEKVDFVYTCGPEMMEKAVFDLAEKHNVPSQVSIERYMKCGFGICGACAVDGKGQRMCVEGPVLSCKDVRDVKEFGQHHRKGTGRKENFS